MTAAAWEGAMTAALEEARAALETGDVPVGAVVVGPDGEIVGRGHNIREAEGDPTGHAEVVALRDAAAAVGQWRLDGHTLVVTLEPCTMCAGAAVLSRVDRVVFAALDLKGGAVGSLWDVVRDRRLNHRPEVILGVLAEESVALLEEFFAAQREHERPKDSPFALVHDLEGRMLMEAVQEAKAAGWYVRAYEEGTEVVSAEHRADRINLEHNGLIVRHAWVG